jgi:23S rRNA (guanine745-N1)-methyltransferase
MNAEVLRYLRCPLCGQALAAAGAGAVRALRCPRGHSFDLARQGYVNLLAGRTPHAGDTADMVVAREEFLGAGHYGVIAAALAETARQELGRIEARSSTPPGIGTAGIEMAGVDAPSTPYPDPPLVVDAGAGTGRYLAAGLDARPAAAGLALDVSKPALRRAARAHPRAGAALCDTWRPLPLPDASASVLLNVFAPRNGPEFRRVLRRDGALLVVTPAADHLAELVGQLDLLRVDPDKAERVAGSLAEHFHLAAETTHRRALRLTHREVHILVGMGPSAWHLDPVQLAVRVGTLPEPVTVTASVRLGTYRPR